MKKVLFVFVAEVLFIIWSDSKIYPVEVKQNYSNGSATSPKESRTECGCLCQTIQSKYSYSEYLNSQPQLKTGKPPHYFLNFSNPVTPDFYTVTQK